MTAWEASERTGIVLVVEDEPIIRLAAVDFLEDAGLAVLEAASGDEGLALLRSQPGIRMLFTDVHMPGPLDGIALSRIAAAEYQHVHLLIVSGRPIPQPDALPDGACFFSKPYELTAVLAHVHSAMC